MSPLLARTGHGSAVTACPLLGHEQNSGGLPGLALTSILARGPKGPTAPRKRQNRVTVTGVSCRQPKVSRERFTFAPCYIIRRRCLPAAAPRSLTKQQCRELDRKFRWRERRERGRKANKNSAYYIRLR